MNYEKFLFLKLLQGPVNINELHCISMAHLIKFILKYQEINVISFENENIRITSDGEKYFLKHRHEILFSLNDKSWTAIPEEVQTNIVEINKQINVRL